MKKFSFPLDRVLNWRSLECEGARARLENLQAEAAAVAQRLLTIQSEREMANQGIADSRDITSAEVATLVHWRAAVRRRLEALEVEKSESTKRVAEQRVVLQELERNVKLLQRLREKRHSEWTIALGLEEEAFATEVFLARCIRLKRDSDTTGA